jgi:transcriptional antiterminator
VTLVEQAITNIEKTFNQKPNENLRVALLDHLNFSIYRFNHGLNITNLFNDELEAMYEKEFNFSRMLLKEINQTMKVSLPDAEIGFITQHIHSALNNDESRSNLFMQIIMNSLEYLEAEHGLKYPKNSLEKIRLITHLKFALKRASEKSTLKNEFSPKILENYPEAYKIAKDLSEYILDNFNIKFQEAEIGYLALHIQLIQSK